MHKKKNYRFNVQKQKKNSRYIYSNCSPTSEVHAALTLLFPAHLYSDRSISLELLSVFLSDSLNYEKGKMKDTMERAKLKSELDNLQRLVDRIPPDILAELKRQQRHTVKER